MAFKRKQDTSSGEIAKFESKGASLTGVYLGSFDHEGEYGPTKKHLFKTETGIKIVFGQKHLTDLLKDEKTGILVRVTYESDKKVGKGRPMKMYTLDIDDQYQASEDEVENEVSAASEPSYPEDEDYEEDTSSDEQITAAAKAKPAASTPSADAIAKAKALLGKVRSKTA